MKNIEIKKNAMKLLCATGLVLTLGGCGSSEPSKTGDKTEEQTPQKETLDIESLKDGDVIPVDQLSELPDRKEFEENGLDYFTMYKKYLYWTDNVGEECPTEISKFEYSGEMEQYSINTDITYTSFFPAEDGNGYYWAYSEAVSIRCVAVTYIEIDGIMYKQITDADGVIQNIPSELPEKAKTYTK